MAKLAADRLDRGADATRLYKKILEGDPSDLLSLDALEKYFTANPAGVAPGPQNRIQLVP